MKTYFYNYRSYFFFSLFLFFTIFSYSQSSPKSDYYTDFLYEKIRDPELIDYFLKNREYQENLKQNGQPIPKDFPSLEDFITSLKTQREQKNILANEMGGGEPFITVDHNNPNIVVASYMMGDGLNLDFPVYYSNDGGITWSKSAFSPLATLQNQGLSAVGGGDPVFAIGKDGRIHMTYLYSHGVSTPGSPNLGTLNMFYCYSDDGGENWTVPTNSIIPVNGVDRQWMAVDNTGGPNDGTLFMTTYITQLFSNHPPSQSLFKKQPQNDFFDSTFVVSIGALQDYFRVSYSNIQIDYKGHINISAYRVGDPGDILFIKSTDGGQSFPNEPTEIGTARSHFEDTEDQKIHSREGVSPSMAIDKDNIFICWTDYANDDINTYYVYSHDGGETFSEPINFGSQLGDTTHYYLMSFLSADDGKLVLASCKIDKQTKNSEFIYSLSLDSGLTFLPPHSLSEQFTHTHDVFAFYGDCYKSDMIGCEAFFSWSSDEIPTVYFQRRNVCDEVNISEISPITHSFSLGQIYPNPSKETIHVDLYLEQQNQTLVEIFNTEGKKVKTFDPKSYTMGNHTLSLDIKDLPANHYLLKVSLEDGMFASRRFLAH